MPTPPDWLDTLWWAPDLTTPTPSCMACRSPWPLSFSANKTCWPASFCQTNRLSSAGPLLNELHWFPVASRIHFKIATLTHKILSTGTPSYLSSLLSHYKPTRQLRSSSSNLLVQPPSKTKFGSLAFHAAAPLIWNGLPADVRSSPSFQTFKKMLKNSLFPQPPHLGHVLIPRLRFVSTGPPGPCHYDLGVCFKLSLLLLLLLLRRQSLWLAD